MNSTVPPRPAQRLTTHAEHGLQRPDPYYWLNQKTNPEVIDHLKAENRYCEAQMAHLQPLRTALYDEMLARIQETDTSAAIKNGDYGYYTRTVEGLPYTLHCRKREGVDTVEEVYLDENQLAEGHEYFSLHTKRVSPNHRYVAWLADVDGGERFVLTVKDLTSGETLVHQVKDLKWSLAWGADNQTLFYCRSDDAQRPHKVFRWHITLPPESEQCVFHEPDERYFLSVSATRDHQYVLINCQSKQTSLVLAVDGHNPESEARVVRARQEGVEYAVSHRDRHFYLCINEDAQNFKVVRKPVDGSDTDEIEVIAHRDDVFLTDLNVFSKHLVLTERSNGLPRLRVIDADSGASHLVAMPEETYQVSAGSNPEFDTDVFHYQYTSLLTPPSVYRVHMTTRESTLLKEKPVLGGYERGEYTTRRIWATTEDGTQVPISLVHKKGIVLDGSNPTYLRGYGSYGYNYPISFGATLVSLMERGVIIAIAHIRGGSEMGRHWYEDGKFFQKKNTFTDFIACAETLIKQGYTCPERLAIGGGSAGGLLMGAVLNERPELFCAALARVPFVDVATTMSDPTIPLTVPEYEEWGDPRGKEVFEYMLSYSPYDQVKNQDYPALFVTAGLNDPRVAYWEPAKWVARLRDRATSQTPVLLRVHMGAGHGGASGRYGHLVDTAWQFGFILDQLGLK